MNSHLVSIIVPVYQVEKYIHHCINSILSQTYKNLEIILVDDGSQDACPQICDEYAEKDNRVYVIHQKNLGLSEARNTGIKIAQGEYIAFVDSDDYISSDMIQILLERAVCKNADISVCNYFTVNGNNSYWRRKPQYEREMTSTQALEDIFTLPNYCEVVVWNKLFHAHLFKDTGILFPCGKIHEDNFTTYKLIYYANKIVYCDQPLYYYVQRDESIMHASFNLKKLQLLEAVDETKNFIIQNNLPLVKQVQNYEIMMLFNILNQLLYEKKKYINVWNEIRCMILNDKKLIERNPYISKRHRIGIFLLQWHLYTPLYKFYYQAKRYFSKHNYKRNILNFKNKIKGVGFYLIPIWLMRVFPIQKNKILFMNFLGQGFGDNGKYIAESLFKKNSNIKMVWITDDQKSLPNYIVPIKKRSIKRLYHFATAKVWVDNCRKNEYEIKRKGQYYIQTWHGGIGPKRVERDVENQLDPAYVKSAKKDAQRTDLMLSNSTFCTELYRRAFWFSGEIMECGSPRVDILFHCTNQKQVTIRKQLGLIDEKVLLYAPTFRKDKKLDSYTLDYDQVLDYLSSKNEKWKIMVRLHPNIADQADSIHFNSSIKNVTNYPDMYELLAITDILITDYSSLMFEAGFVQKPVFLFATDIENYMLDRNFYFDITKLPFPLAKNNKELLENMKNYNHEKYQQEINKLNSLFGVKEHGTASDEVAKKILQILGETNEQ